MKLQEKLLLASPIILFAIIVLITYVLPYILKEKFNSEKKSEVNDFDKQVIQLDKLKNDDPKIKDFKPKKTSELKLFCNQGADASKLSCYQQ